MTRPTRLLLVLALAVGAGAPALAQTATSASANDPNRLICRRIQETGSLVRTTRQCFTRAEWDRIAETARRGAQRTVTDLSGGFNGNN